MNLVHSKDIYNIMRDVLKCLDPRIINHGQRTAYILYSMLRDQNRYEMYELAEFAMTAVFHDIGAFETNMGDETLNYESKDCMPHSIYGYLFMLYLMPFKDKAKILLHHHTDFSIVSKMDYEYRDIVACLNVAEKADIYYNLLGSRFDMYSFKKHEGTRYSPKALELLFHAQKKYDIFGRIGTDEYLKELDELFSYLIFTNEEKRGALDGLMYCVGFRSEYTMLDVVTCENICSQLAIKLDLSMEDEEALHYAAILHDAGVCAVPRDIIEAPRKLTDEEMIVMRKHVEILDNILRGRFDDKVVDIVYTHHERGNGKGYPRGLNDTQMTRVQKVLQVADTITGLTSRRSYREPKEKPQVIEILKSESASGKLSSEIVRKFINSYDDIMETVQRENKRMLSMYEKLKDNYEAVRKQNGLAGG